MWQRQCWPGSGVLPRMTPTPAGLTPAGVRPRPGSGSKILVGVKPRPGSGSNFFCRGHTPVGVGVRKFCRGQNPAGGGVNKISAGVKPPAGLGQNLIFDNSYIISLYHILFNLYYIIAIEKRKRQIPWQIIINKKIKYLGTPKYIASSCCILSPFQ